MSKAKYVIGTRGSLLAVAQSSLIQQRLQEISGQTFELKTIQTQGDQQTEKPLWQMDGKDFFTKELDTALLQEEVDLVVHSYKDLAHDRPEGIQIGAITRREYPHDILLVEKKRLPQIIEQKHFVVGTSSPRRIVNLQTHLSPYLPGTPKNVETKVLRGNVNTRIQKLLDGQYDAIVLAMAGLERLLIAESSRSQAQTLLTQLNFMLLPLEVFTPAASQGALAIEYCQENQSDAQLKGWLSQLHHQTTAEEVQRERQQFKQFGGGCHLAVGICVQKHSAGFIHYQRGEFQQKSVKETHFERLEALEFKRAQNLFIGLPLEKAKEWHENPRVVLDQWLGKQALEQAPLIPKQADLLLSTSYGLSGLKSASGYRSLWAAGTQTHRLCAQHGHWVNASADHLGEAKIQHFLNSRAVLSMLGTPSGPLYSLTNEQSETLGERLTTYKRRFTPPTPEQRQRILNCQAFFWTSFYQYQQFTQVLPELLKPIYLHACGPGKTYKQFKSHGLRVKPFLSSTDFYAQLS